MFCPVRLVLNINANCNRLVKAYQSQRISVTKLTIPAVRIGSVKSQNLINKFGPLGNVFPVFCYFLLVLEFASADQKLNVNLVQFCHMFPICLVAFSPFLKLEKKTQN